MLIRGFCGLLCRLGRGRCRFGGGWKLRTASSSAGVTVATSSPSSLARLRNRSPPARLQITLREHATFSKYPRH